MLLSRERVPVVEAVERLGGLQAQEPRPPFVGLWTRVEGFEADDLRSALRSGKVVRATLMRATLHLVSARDYADLRPALQPALDQAMRALGSRAKGLDVEALLPVAEKLVRERPRTFNELRPLLLEAFPDVNERALGYATRLALPLVMVPSEDPWGFPRDTPFALPAKPVRKRARPERLVERYLGAFGPATAADFQAWSGLRGVKPVLDAMRDGLEVFQDERGRELFDLPGAPRPGEEAEAPARLLPDFDNLVLAHDDRSRLIADEHRPKVTTKNLRVKATFLVDGVVRGTWAIERKKVALEPFGRLPKAARDELLAEGEQLMRFLG
jgi:hypothetical protein